MIGKYNNQELFDIVNHQLSNFWIRGGVPETNFLSLETAVQRIENNFIHRKGKIFQYNGEARFDVVHSVQYAIFLYTYSNQLFLDGNEDAAGKIYYLNKIMNSVDWFYEVKMPSIFSAEHPIGSVVGRAKMDDYLFLYQGTTIGGNHRVGTISYPVIGKHVLMYADSKIIGDSHIGNNVVLASNTYIIDEDIPDNCIVFGQSPNLVIKQKTEQDIKEKMEHIWLI